MSYELTRRDALAVLAAGGAAGAAAVTGGLGTDGDDDTAEDGSVDDHDRETLVALSRTVYPSEVTGIEAFVGAYVEGRLAGDPERAASVGEAVATLDEYCRDWDDAPYVDLDADRRDGILRDFGVDRAEPDPEGHRAERVRHYLVNDLLYALYASPTGGELVGIENPQGHPGGARSYRRPP